MPGRARAASAGEAVAVRRVALTELPCAHRLPHRLSFVKPYDVCALMTVLPFCAQFFDNIGVRIPVGEGEQRNPPPQPSSRARVWLARLSGRSQQSARADHLLLLTSEDELAQVHVLNMLRDTYHEVSKARAACPDNAAPSPHPPSA